MSKERAVKYIISKYDTMKECNKHVIQFDVGKTAFEISQEDDGIWIKYISMHGVEVNYGCSDISQLEDYVKTIFV